MHKIRLNHWTKHDRLRDEYHYIQSSKFYLPLPCCGTHLSVNCVKDNLTFERVYGKDSTNRLRKIPSPTLLINPNPKPPPQI